MSTPKRPRVWSGYQRLILVAGLALVTLFVMGPQAGSLDCDGDGIPEVPVVLMAASIVAGPLSLTNLQDCSRTALAVAAGEDRSLLPAPSVLACGGRSFLRACCQLRC